MKSLLLIMTAIAAFTLSACNTVAGAGKDIEKAADWTKEKISK